MNECQICRVVPRDDAGKEIPMVPCLGRYPWDKHCPVCRSRCGECNAPKPTWRQVRSRRDNGIREEGNEWDGWVLVA